MKRSLLVLVVLALLLVGCKYAPPDSASPTDSPSHRLYYDPTNGIIADVACGYETGFFGTINYNDCLITIRRTVGD